MVKINKKFGAPNSQISIGVGLPKKEIPEI
jgi:hypothetical protein